MQENFEISLALGFPSIERAKFSMTCNEWDTAKIMRQIRPYGYTITDLQLATIAWMQSKQGTDFQRFLWSTPRKVERKTDDQLLQILNGYKQAMGG